MNTMTAPYRCEHCAAVFYSTYHAEKHRADCRHRRVPMCDTLLDLEPDPIVVPTMFTDPSLARAWRDQIEHTVRYRDTNDPGEIY